MASALVAAAATPWVACAQYAATFEPTLYTSGAALVGQPTSVPFYLPPEPMTSNAFVIGAYAANPWQFSPQPLGGSQFAMGKGPGAGMIGRAQRNLPLANWGCGTWTICYDMAVLPFTGLSPDIGSFSLEPAASKRFAQLFQPVGPTAGWNAPIQAANAAGAGIVVTPSPDWTGLPFQAWHRLCVTINFPTRQITSASITNLWTGASDTEPLVGVYLRGGAAGTLPTPSAFRLTVGGSSPGNTIGFDNVSFTSVLCACYPDCTEDGHLTVADFGCFQSRFVAGDPFADCNADAGLTVADFGCFQTRFVAGCP
ncbi:MAG: GC-type dockerin domain-anchored protein [Phycisphaerales bacterium]